MKRYRFRLEQVLRVRRTEEDLAKGMLLRANLELRRAEAALDAARQRRAARPALTGRASTGAYLADRFIRERLAETVRLAEDARRAAVASVEVARDAWAGAAQKVSVLERLDQRRRAEHRLAGNREDAAEVDDVVVGRYGRTA